RSFSMGIRQPCMERKHRDFDGKSKRKSKKHPGLCYRVEIQPEEIEKAEIGNPCAHTLEVQSNDSNKHQEGADHSIDEEFDRCVDPVLPTPDADDEVHRDQHDFPEDVEEKEIERDECAEHADFQQKEAGHVTLYLLVYCIPGPENGNRHDEGRQHYEPEAYTINADVIVHPEWTGLDPGHVENELVVCIRDKAGG